MKKTKRIIAAAAALTLCFGAVSPACEAADVTHKNAVYAAEIVDFDEIEGKNFSNIDDAVLYVREQLKQFNPAIKVILSEGLGMSDREVSSTMREKVFEHTGDPKEGDYLLLAAPSYASNCHSVEGTGTVFTMQVNYSSTPEAEEQAEPKYQELVTYLKSFMFSDAGDVDKIKNIYDYMTSNVMLFVDETDISRSAASYVLLNGFGTSMGYCQLLIRLLGEFGYDASIHATNVEFDYDTYDLKTYHCLVMVKLNGKNYFLDPVWDNKLGGDDRNRFFLKGYKDIDSDVPEDSQYHHELLYDYDDEIFTEEFGISENAFDTSLPVYKLGDVNNDGIVDSVDASNILAEYARLSSENGIPAFTDLQKWAGDIDGNGLIDAVDASSVLSYYAYLSTLDMGTIPRSLESFIQK